MYHLQLVEEKIKSMFWNESSGHDWYHVDRVRKLALLICEREGGNRDLVEAAALLHDVPDAKLNDSKEAGYTKLTDCLSILPFSVNEKKEIEEIVLQISYKGGNETELSNINAKIVRDADRLDAIGAIGIARTFAYGGKKGNPIYDPNILVRDQMTEEEYRNQHSSTIHHFYEKLLMLKDLMTTRTGKELADERHKFMEQFLIQFYREWDVLEFVQEETQKKI